jgi:hypothetical protein
MSQKLINITLGILLGFLLVSFSLYKLRMNSATSSLQQNEPSTQAGKSSQTMDGKVQSIDLSQGILCLDGNGKRLDFAFDGATVFVEDGRAIQPSTINSGNSVTVIFIQRENRNLARNIFLCSTK